MLCARKLWTHAWKHIFNGKIHALCRMYNGRCRLPKVGTRGTNMQKTAASKHCATSWQHTRGKLPLSCIWLVSVISFILLHSYVCLLAFFFLFRTKCDFSAFFLFYSSSHFFLFVCLSNFLLGTNEIWRLWKSLKLTFISICMQCCDICCPMSLLSHLSSASKYIFQRDKHFLFTALF